jgi:hypothetical protein
LILALFALNRAAISVVSAGWGVAMALATPLALFGLGWALSYPLGVWPAAHPLDHANPAGGTLALGLGMMFGPMALAWLAAAPGAQYRADPRVVALCAYGLAAVAAVAVSRFLPGATHAFLGPVLTFGIVALIETFVRPGRGFSFAIIAGFVAAAFFWMSYFVALLVVFGFANSESRLAAMAVFGLTMLPLFYAAFRDGSSKAAVGGTAIALAAATVWGAASEPYSPEHPRGTALIYAQTVDGKAHWVLNGPGPLDATYVKTQGFETGHGGLGGLGLLWGPVAQKATPPLGLAAPVWSETSRRDDGDATIVTGTLRAARDGLFLGIAAPAGSGVFSVAFNGAKPIAREPSDERGVFVRALGLRSEPAAVEFRFVKGKSANVLILEQSALPDTANAEALSAARGPNTRTVQSGDVAYVLQKVELATQLAAR